MSLILHIPRRNDHRLHCHIMCTLSKQGNFFTLTLSGDDDHRLNPNLIATILSALQKIKSQATHGSVLITTSQGKFFSNGFDLAWAKKSAAADGGSAMERLHEMVVSFKPVIAEMISLPMPTIAALQGHAAAAGFLFALSHDYVLMRSDKGVLYMSEVDLGLPLPDYFSAAFRAKIYNVCTRRDILLRGAKVKGVEAVKMGIVDAAYDSEEKLVEATMSLAEQLAKRKWNGENYQEIRKSLFPDLCGVLGLVEAKLTARL
ncbi:catalytic, putative [Ricinus communis]|uniref:Delta(3)-Delta(2)-enoyl-CoA isomerase n=1 Tax=Ricinus communis TaxID=3988 RepID=B9STJ1_RICCO|nr:catalytic, putative [Ricinus communis]|eukprot:XP_002529310.1 enoyl-CoA delta isomerase 2, peroxisomal [Ricinus communis]